MLGKRQGSNWGPQAREAVYVGICPLQLLHMKTMTQIKYISYEEQNVSHGTRKGWGAVPPDHPFIGTQQAEGEKTTLKLNLPPSIVWEDDT